MALELSNAEFTQYRAVWTALSDPFNESIVQGGVCQLYFASSGLSGDVLATVWSISDPNDTGALDWNGFAAFMRLIAHLQSDPCLDVNPSLLNVAPDRLPQLAPLDDSFIKEAEEPIGVDRWLPIPSEDEAEYERLFLEQDEDHSGYLEGPRVKRLLLSSGLSTQQLYKIWDLVDIARKGRLHVRQFKIASHIISTVLSTGVDCPDELPQELLDYIEYADDSIKVVPQGVTRRESPMITTNNREINNLPILDEQIINELQLPPELKFEAKASPLNGVQAVQMIVQNLVDADSVLLGHLRELSADEFGDFQELQKLITGIQEDITNKRAVLSGQMEHQAKLRMSTSHLRQQYDEMVFIRSELLAQLSSVALTNDYLESERNRLEGELLRFESDFQFTKTIANDMKSIAGDADTFVSQISSASDCLKVSLNQLVEQRSADEAKLGDLRMGLTRLYAEHETLKTAFRDDYERSRLAHHDQTVLVGSLERDAVTLRGEVATMLRNRDTAEQISGQLRMSTQSMRPVVPGTPSRVGDVSLLDQSSPARRWNKKGVPNLISSPTNFAGSPSGVQLNVSPLGTRPQLFPLKPKWRNLESSGRTSPDSLRRV